MHQIARIEFQKCIFFSFWGGHIPQTPPVHASAERGAGAPLWSLFLQHPRGKQSWICPCLSLVPFILGLIKEKCHKMYQDIKENVTFVSRKCYKMYHDLHVNLLLFQERASRLEHEGLNKYFQHIFKVTMTCFTTRHIQRGGGVRATFFNSEGAKINDSMGPPPGVRPPG